MNLLTLLRKKRVSLKKDGVLKAKREHGFMQMKTTSSARHNRLFCGLCLLIVNPKGNELSGNKWQPMVGVLVTSSGQGFYRFPCFVDA
jgi:hypothetical protein